MGAISLPVWVLVVLVLALAGALLGCVTVGDGSATLVPVRKDKQDPFTKYFGELVSETDSLRALTPGAPTDRNDYLKFLRESQGDESRSSSDLSLVARDRTKIPPFLPIDVGIEKSLLTTFLDKDLSSAKKDELAAAARARINNAPDLPFRTALHDEKDGKPRYFYYPTLGLNFSTKLNSASQLDRFQYLAMVIKLKDDVKANGAPATCDPVRFVDFQPKASDVVEFTLGQLTQNAQLNAKTNLVNSEVNQLTNNQTTGPSGGQTTSGATRTNTNTLTPEISMQMSESFVNALKDSIEARTAGTLEKGRAFFADFRAIKSKRIGGTYNFDVMIEVPTYIDPASTDYYTSFPCVERVQADAYLVGVVRRVHKRGFTGWFTRVPEPDNDRVYLQVEVQPVPDVLLWEYAGVPWTRSAVQKPTEYTITVVTNRSDARYVVRTTDAAQKILGDGSGASSKIVVPGPIDTVAARVEFLDLIDGAEKANTRILAASPSPNFTLEKGKAGKFTVTGTYAIKP